MNKPFNLFVLIILTVPGATRPVQKRITKHSPVARSARTHQSTPLPHLNELVIFALRELPTAQKKLEEAHKLISQQTGSLELRANNLRQAETLYRQLIHAPNAPLRDEARFGLIGVLGFQSKWTEAEQLLEAQANTTHTNIHIAHALALYTTTLLQKASESPQEIAQKAHVVYSKLLMTASNDMLMQISRTYAESVMLIPNRTSPELQPHNLATADIAELLLREVIARSEDPETKRNLKNDLGSVLGVRAYIQTSYAKKTSDAQEAKKLFGEVLQDPRCTPEQRGYAANNFERVQSFLRQTQSLLLHRPNPQPPIAPNDDANTDSE